MEKSHHNGRIYAIHKPLTILFLVEMIIAVPLCHVVLTVWCCYYAAYFGASVRRHSNGALVIDKLCTTLCNIVIFQFMFSHNFCYHDNNYYNYNYYYHHYHNSGHKT